MSKKELEQPYCKDNNVLQLSLFYFGKDRKKYTISEWVVKENGELISCKLEADCRYGVPGALEQDVYTSVMRKWVEQGMPDDAVEVSYSDIAKILDLDPESNATRIKKALKKIAHTRYELTQCFLQAENVGEKPLRVSTHFSLFDSASLFDYAKGKSKKKSMSKIYFPKEIRKNLECKYYQMLDMKWYKKLPSGLTRRLYEYLEKRRYQSKNGTFQIRESLLSQWLPITDSKLSRRKNSIEKYAKNLIVAGFLEKYEYDKEKNLCRFTYATVKPISPRKKEKVNDVSIENIYSKEDVSKQLKFVEALDWLNGIPYFHKKKRQEVAALPMEHVVSLYDSVREEYERTIKSGTHLRPSWIYNKFTTGVKALPCIERKEERCATYQMNFYEAGDKYSDLYKLLKKDTKAIRKKIPKFIEKYGYQHVKENILYANKNAKKSYSSYLFKAIEDSWGNAWAEEEEENIKKQELVQKKKQLEEQKRIEEENRKRKLEESLKKERVKFKNEVKKTRKMRRDMCLEKAENLVDKNSFGRELNVKIEYVKLLLQLFNEKEKVFSDEITSDLKFIKEVAKI